MLVALSLSWGTTWVSMKLSLAELSPFSLRLSSTFLGTVMLVGYALVLRKKFTLPMRPMIWFHVAMAGLFNIVGFGLFATFAQLSAATSRVAILAYTMPIWTVLLSFLFLHERLNRVRTIALLLCMSGISILVYPLTGSGVSTLIGMFLAVMSGVSWAVGIIYVKWVKLPLDPLTFAIWQFVFSFFMIAALIPPFEGVPHLWPLSWTVLWAALFTGLIGSGLSYFLWFEIIHRLPAMTASLGILGSPFVGVVSSMIILGERPSVADFTGFALIFSAAACVLLAPPPKVVTESSADPRRSPA